MNANSADEVLHIFHQTLYLNPELGFSSQIIRGYYSKRILIMVKSDEIEPDADTLLTKMLQACQLKEDDYYLIAVDSPKAIFSLVSTHHPDTLLLFGLNFDSDMVQLNKPLYKPFRLNGIKILLSDSLQKLNIDASLKSALWTNGLKPLFSI
jgi:DNA polymerase III psi subunit